MTEKTAVMRELKRNPVIESVAFFLKA